MLIILKTASCVGYLDTRARRSRNCRINPRSFESEINSLFFIKLFSRKIKWFRYYFSDVMRLSLTVFLTRIRIIICTENMYPSVSWWGSVEIKRVPSVGFQIFDIYICGSANKVLENSSSRTNSPWLSMIVLL